MAEAEESTLRQRAPETLNPHPLNTEVYDDQNDLDESFLSK